MPIRRRLSIVVLAVVLLGCGAATNGDQGSTDDDAAGSLTNDDVVASGDVSELATEDPVAPPPAGEAVVAWLLAAPDALLIQFSGCDNGAAVSIEEDVAEVGVLVAGPNGDCEPLYGRELELAEPLGGREVVDRSTGLTVNRQLTRPEFIRDALRRARESWRDAGISDYDLEVVQTSASLGEATAVFQVRDGESVSSEAVAGFTEAQVQQLPSTVEQLFALVEGAVDARRPASVEFDVERGHPSQVVVVEDPGSAPNGTTWFILLTPTATS